jgi:hypothetical protein
MKNTLDVEISLVRPKRGRPTQRLGTAVPLPARIPRIARLMALAIKFRRPGTVGDGDACAADADHELDAAGPGNSGVSTEPGSCSHRGTICTRAPLQKDCSGPGVALSAADVLVSLSGSMNGGQFLPCCAAHFKLTMRALFLELDRTPANDTTTQIVVGIEHFLPKLPCYSLLQPQPRRSGYASSFRPAGGAKTRWQNTERSMPTGLLTSSRGTKRSCAPI